MLLYATCYYFHSAATYQVLLWFAKCCNLQSVAVFTVCCLHRVATRQSAVVINALLPAMLQLTKSAALSSVLLLARCWSWHCAVACNDVATLQSAATCIQNDSSHVIQRHTDVCYCTTHNSSWLLEKKRQDRCGHFIQTHWLKFINSFCYWNVFTVIFPTIDINALHCY